MLGPQQNWLEWEWRVTTGGALGLYNQIDGRVWRVQASSVGGGLITFQFPAGALANVTVLPGQTITLEPHGMFALAIQFSAGIDFWAVEWIRRLNRTE